MLEETGLDPASLTLEITEGVLVTESEATAQTLIDLKALGLRLVLDDFGTGYSSLAYLRRFPIDGLKIDRRFIAAMDTSAEDRTIVEAIVKMAAGLRIDVVAEGVETIEQADSLRRLGCLTRPGLLLRAPMAPGDVAGLFEHSLPFDESGGVQLRAPGGHEGPQPAVAAARLEGELGAAPLDQRQAGRGIALDVVHDVIGHVLKVPRTRRRRSRASRHPRVGPPCAQGVQTVPRGGP